MRLPDQEALAMHRTGMPKLTSSELTAITKLVLKHKALS